MHFNINVGTFVPKSHTPFQWAGQLGREEAEKKINFLKARLKPQGHKLGIQDPAGVMKGQGSFLKKHTLWDAGLIPGANT
jgi:hypothetical protein